MFQRVAIIGLGLQGGSIGLAVREYLPGTRTTGFDIDPATRKRAAERGLTDRVCETAAEAVREADLVILCVPPGAMGAAAREIAETLPANAVVSDVGSCKQSIAEALGEALPDHLAAEPAFGPRSGWRGAGCQTKPGCSGQDRAAQCTSLPRHGHFGVG